MKTFRSAHILLVLVGIYSPSLSNASLLKKLLWKVYSIVPLTMMYSLLTVQLLDLLLNVKNLDEFTDNFATTSVILVDCIKHKILSHRRDSVAALTDMLDKNPFTPATEREMKIRERYDKLVELNTNVYALFFCIAGMVGFVATFIVYFKQRTLTVAIWLPYNYSSATMFILTSAYELAAAECAIMTTAGCDSLYTGLLLHICGQLKMLEHRIKTLTEEGHYSLHQCAAHHYNIYKFAKTVNEKFTEVMFVQFVTSMAILALNMYRILTVRALGTFMVTLLYLFATFSQIAYYCWYSNEVKLKSINFVDEIFASDWVTWDDHSKKVLLMVIKRSAKPIEFSCIYILPINLESFMALLKTSYSALNLMTQTR